MKKNFCAVVALCFSLMMLSSCGMGMMGPGTGTGTTPNSNGNESVLGTGAGDLGSILGGVIGILTGNTGSSVVGTWVYQEPAVQFESENWLAKAGGQIAANTVVKKLITYYQKVGIKAGSSTLTFKEDGTCTAVFGGKTHNGNYVYDSKNNKLEVNLAGREINLPGSCSVDGSRLLYTFKTDALLGAVQKLSTVSSNSNLSTIGKLAQSFNGMQTGFTFVKQ